MDIRRDNQGMRFKVLGINFHISVPFTVMLAFLLIVDKTGLMSASIFAVVVHELGHILMMRHLKCLPREVSFCIFGISIVGASFCTFKENIKIAIFGPLANFFLFVVFYIIGVLMANNLILAFSAVQLVEGTVNMFPVIGLDGGTVLKCIVNSLNIKGKNLIINGISFLTAFAVFILGMAVAVKNVSNPSLLLLGIYLIITHVYKFNV